MSLSINTTTPGGIRALSQAEFKSNLLTFRGTGFATMTANTAPAMKAGGQFRTGEVTKRYHGQILWGASMYHGSSLERAWLKENPGRSREDLPDFDVAPPPFGERLVNPETGKVSSVVACTPKSGPNKGKLTHYLRCRMGDRLSPLRYFETATGMELDPEEVTPCLRPSYKPKNQEPLKEEVYVRTYSLAGIVEFVTAGEVWQILKKLDL